MKVIRCNIEDLPNHINTIERYTHLLNVDIVTNGIRDHLIQYAKESYSNPDSNVIPTKIIDDTGNVLAYLSFYYAKTKPVVITKGGFLTEYGRQHHTPTDLYSSISMLGNYLDIIFATKKDTTEFLIFQRMARSRFNIKVFKQLTEPGMPLQGWAVRVRAEIPPYGLIKDPLMARWVAGYFNGLIPERMTITQISKIS
jgi:hypothetical protein